MVRPPARGINTRARGRGRVSIVKKLLGVIAVLAVGFGAVGARAADTQVQFKFAYVDMEKVMSEYVLFAEAQKDAEAKIKATRDLDKTKMETYQAEIADLEKKLSGPLAPEAKAQVEAAYSAKVSEALEFRDSAVAKYKQIERDSFEPVYKKVYDKVASYAQRKSYDVVFDYSATLLFAKKDYDISEDIIKELNEEAGVTTPANP